MAKVLRVVVMLVFPDLELELSQSTKHITMVFLRKVALDRACSSCHLF